VNAHPKRKLTRHDYDSGEMHGTSFGENLKQRPRRVHAIAMALRCCTVFGGIFVACRATQNPVEPLSFTSADQASPVSAFVTHELTFSETTFLKQYCSDCHAGGKHKGSFSIDGLLLQPRELRHTETWQAIAAQIASGDMPPEDKPLPSNTERQALANWVNTNIVTTMCSVSEPGRVVARRLNRSEYTNTITDLLGTPFDLGHALPTDNAAHGFDNIAASLTMSPLLLERYVDTAAMALDAVVFDPERGKRAKTSLQADMTDMNQFVRQAGNGGVLLSHAPAGQISMGVSQPFATRFRVSVLVRSYHDGLKRKRLRDKNSGKHDPFVIGPALLSFNVDGIVSQTRLVRNKTNQRYTVDLSVPAGPHRIQIGAIKPEQVAPTVPRTIPSDILVSNMAIDGPLDIPTEPTETHRRVFFTEATNERDVVAAETIVKAFARRAFRQPVDDATGAALLSVVTRAWDDGANFVQGVQLGLQAVLVSPRFLFRTDLVREESPDATFASLTPHALASRLSYFLWSTMPDDELIQQADDGTLTENLDTQIDRMLADPRTRALTQNFGGQWLQFKNMEEVAPTTFVFKSFQPEMRGDFRHETELFFDHIMRTDQSVMDFLVGDYTFVNERLAKHYGIQGIAGPEFRKVSLVGLPRRGVLTHASTLTITSRSTRTSPAMRGKWVLDTLLGTPPPPPPPAVPDLEGDDHMELRKIRTTLRSRLEKHRDNPVCASCHARFDPIGFALEPFDGVGAYRETDASLPIDAKGELNTGESFNGPFELIQVLASTKKSLFIRTFATKLFTYAMGREPRSADKCIIDAIVARAQEDNLRFSSFVKGIVKSAPFLNSSRQTEPQLAADDEVSP